MWQTLRLSFLLFCLSAFSFSQVISGLSTAGPAPWVDVTAYGAKADSQVQTLCNLSTLNTIVGKNVSCGVAGSGPFLPTDIGKNITIYEDIAGSCPTGAPVAPYQFLTTIQSVTDTNNAVLSQGVGSNYSGCTVRWSTDNFRPIQNAINALNTRTSGTAATLYSGATLHFPYAGTGNYYIGAGQSGMSLQLGVNPLPTTPVLLLTAGIRLVGECGAPGNLGGALNQTNCSTLVTDQPLTMLTVGDTINKTTTNPPTKFHSGLTIQDLGFVDVSVPDASTLAANGLGAVRLINTEDFNLTNVRVQRFISGYGLLFDGGVSPASPASQSIAQFGVVINPSIANTLIPIETNLNTSEINFYGGNVGCQSIGSSPTQIPNSIGFNLGGGSTTEGAPSAGEWGVFGTHVLDCITGVALQNVNILQWYGVAEITIGTKPTGSTGVSISSDSTSYGGGNLIAGSISNFATGISVSGNASGTIVAGSITNNGVEVNLAGSSAATKIIGTLGAGASVTPLVVANNSILQSTSILTNADYAAGSGGVAVGSQIPTNLTIPQETAPATPPVGRTLFVSSTSHDLSVLRPGSAGSSDLENGTVLTFFCTGTFGANTTIYPSPGGNSGGCGANVLTEIKIPVSGTLKNLYVTTGVGGTGSTDGQTVVWVNGSATGLKCTVGTSTGCSDLSDTAAITAGNTLSIRVATTGTGENMANMRVSLQLQ